MPRDEQQTTGLAGRARSLDGLRGVAAVVVVVHHALLTNAIAASAYLGPRLPGLDWLTYSPLHLLWAGNEAVRVFFVLSGIVLTLPVIRLGGFSARAWGAYYPSRLVRLYLPVVVSEVLALLLILSVSRADLVGRGAWLAGHANAPSKLAIIRDITLVTGAGNLNTVLWSLQWEVLFSLLLPVYVLVARRTGRLWWVAMAVAILASAAGTVSGYAFLEYLPLFLIGSLIAANQAIWTRTAAWIDRLPVRRVVWPVLLVAALLGTISRWLVPPSMSEWMMVPVNAGVTVLVLLAVYWAPFKRVLETRLVLWLGAVSFSLYLVHEPIIVTTVALFPGWSWAVPVVAIPIAVVVAWLFSRAVEQPSHRLAQLLRRRLLAAPSQEAVVSR